MADPKMARQYLDAGAQFVAVGVDTTLLVRAATDLATAFKGDPAVKRSGASASAQAPVDSSPRVY